MGNPRKPEPLRYCAKCREPLIRKRWKGRLEDYGTFCRRKYCDRKCWAERLMEG